LSLLVTPSAPREERFLKNNFVVKSVRRTVPKKERLLKNNLVVESVQPSAPRKGRFLKKNHRKWEDRGQKNYDHHHHRKTSVRTKVGKIMTTTATEKQV